MNAGRPPRTLAFMDGILRVAPEPAPGALFIELPFHPELPGDPPRAILSLKAAGDMKYEPSAEGPGRASIRRSLGIAPGALRGIRLLHSRDAFWAEEDSSQGGDGLLTRDRGLVPSVTVADCMPIYLYDAASGAFGLLHSGWKGTGIVVRALERLRGGREGEGMDSLGVILGPAIGGECYEVDEERAAVFEAEFGPEAVLRGGGRPRLSLLGANLALLRKKGVRHITVIDSCTRCSPFLGSYRREGSASFTRMIALAGYFPGP